MSEKARIDVSKQLKRITKHDGKWLHKNGKTYEVIYIANEHANETDRSEYPLMVVYRNESGRVWAKTPESFLRSRVEKPNECCVCGSTENLHKDGIYGYRCNSPDCICF